MEFVFSGIQTRAGVNFFIEATDKAEAIAKAKAGDYFEVDDLCAETIDVKIFLSSCEINE
jgi:hypothetical protein